MHRVGLLGNGTKLLVSSTQKIVDTIRILAQSQDDVSAYNISTFFARYNRPPEGAELMISLDASRYEISRERKKQNVFLPLLQHSAHMEKDQRDGRLLLGGYFVTELMSMLPYHTGIVTKS